MVKDKRHKAGKFEKTAKTMAHALLLAGTVAAVVGIPALYVRQFAEDLKNKKRYDEGQMAPTWAFERFAQAHPALHDGKSGLDWVKQFDHVDITDSTAMKKNFGDTITISNYSIPTDVFVANAQKMQAGAQYMQMLEIVGGEGGITRTASTNQTPEIRWVDATQASKTNDTDIAR
jgi:hypothetical protein